MEIKTKKHDSITVIEIAGTLDSATAQKAQDEIMPFVTPKSELVLDLNKCSYISSAGLRVLLMITKQLSILGGIWALAGVSDEVKDVIEMTGFSNLLKIYDTMETAFQAVKKNTVEAA